MFITPGTGIDPTNEFRDAAGGEGFAGGTGTLYKGQVTGQQDLVERNKLKVSLDFFIQGFCLTSLTLRPSAFYGTASARTASLRSHIWRNVSSASGAACLHKASRLAEGWSPDLLHCVQKSCRLRRCNTVQ